MRKIGLSILVFLLTVSLIGCSMSENDAVDQTTNVVEKTFNSSSKATTNTSGNVSYFLPDGFEVESEEENNIVLQKSGQQYILFVNQMEDANSKGVYEATLSDQIEPILNETYDENGEFRFLLLYPTKNKKEYELIVGIGGRKVTTKTKTNNMAEDATYMVEIVKSLKN